MKRAALFFTLWFGILVAAGLYLHHESTPKQLDRLWNVPPFEMTAITSAGVGKLRQSDLLGRPWIANFIYTRCAGPCPLLSSRMVELQRILPAQVRLVSFTVDPDHDTPAVLQAYAARFHADPRRWSFARADKGTLTKIAYEGFHVAAVEDPSAPSGYRVTHSTKLVLVDAKGVVRRFYDGNEDSVAQAIGRDVEKLLKEPA